MIKHIGSVQFGFEIGGTGEDKIGTGNFVVFDEALDGGFGNFSNIVVTFLHSQTGKTQCRLTTATVFLWQINSELHIGVVIEYPDEKVTLVIISRVLPVKVPKRQPLPSMTMNPKQLSSVSKSERASVWNLLSQRYREVLIGLKGSKSIVTFFSFPSSVIIVPQYTTRPFGGTRISKLYLSKKHNPTFVIELETLLGSSNG